MIAWFIVAVLGLVVLAMWQAKEKMRKEHELLQVRLQAAERILSFRRTLQSRRDVSQGEYEKCLRRLGFTSLAEYQRSDHWRRTKQRYRNSDYPQRCLVCGARDFDLHHRTYERLGNEALFDLVPLCSLHHRQFHELLDPNPSLSVKDTHDYLIRLLDQDVPDESGEQEEDRLHRAEAKPERSRAGKPWSAEEEVELLRCFERKMTIEKIAERMHRGAKGIEVKLFKLGKVSLQ